MATLTDLQYGQYETVEQDDYTTQIFIDFQNKRLNLTKYKGDIEKIIKNTINLGEKYGAGKILATVQEEDYRIFPDNGFVQEAVIDGYFNGKIGYNVSYFSDPNRAISHAVDDEDKIIEKANEYKGQYQPLQNSAFSIRTGNIEDVNALAHLYDTVFKTYPTPMHNIEYIKNIIHNNKVFFMVAEYDNQIVSAASADLNHEFSNAEITDCATLDEYRGKGLVSELIFHLESSLKEKNFNVLFSVARAISPGINIVFSKHEYQYTGRQINNTNIMGKLEDMNIWVKKI